MASMKELLASLLELLLGKPRLARAYVPVPVRTNPRR